MKTNIIPNSHPQLLHLALSAIAGAEELGGSIDLTHFPAPKIRGAYNDLHGEQGDPDPAKAVGKQGAYYAQRRAFSAAIATRNASIEEAREFCALAIAVLKRAFGRQWNAAWESVGFHRFSLAVPANPLSLLTEMAGFYGQYPEHEFSVLGLTAAEAKAHGDAIAAATLAVAEARAERIRSKRERDAALKHLRQCLVGLRAELALLLGPSDPRWMPFGFQRPAAGHIPEPVEGLVVTRVAPDTMLVKWNRTNRADGYRVSWQIEGSAAEVSESILTCDPATHLTGLPISETIVVSVSARNRSGETKAAFVAVTAADRCLPLDHRATQS